MPDEQTPVQEAVEKVVNRGQIQFHPEDRDPAGRPEATQTTAEIIKEMGELESAKRASYTRRKSSVEAQWEKAESGELASLNWLTEKTEGRVANTTNMNLTATISLTDLYERTKRARAVRSLPEITAPMDTGDVQPDPTAQQ
jgi:hypothetical protein